jgi:hypothetical protein
MGDSPAARIARAESVAPAAHGSPAPPSVPARASRPTIPSTPVALAEAARLQAAQSTAAPVDGDIATVRAKRRSNPIVEPEPVRCPACGMLSRAPRCPADGTRLRSE